MTTGRYDIKTDINFLKGLHVKTAYMNDSKDMAADQYHSKREAETLKVLKDL